MTPRHIFILLTGFLLMTGCGGGDDSTGPDGGVRYGLNFDALGSGTLDTAVTEGWLLDVDENALDEDAPEVVDLGGGDMGLRDPNGGDMRRSVVSVQTDGQRLFHFVSLDAADLSASVNTSPSSEIRIRGYRLDELVGTDYFGTNSADPVTLTSDILESQELSRLVIDIYSTGEDDFCVSFLELTPVATALVDFDPLPLGGFEHLFIGEFELTWEDTEFQQEVVAYLDDEHVLTDPVTDDMFGAAVFIERVGGGAFELEVLYAVDLLGPDALETHNDSRILIEGWRNGQLVGMDTFMPTDTEIVPFVADALAGVEVEFLRLSVLSVCGVYECDDLGVAGFVLSIEE